LKYGVVVDDIDNREKHKNPEFEKKRPLARKIVRRLNGEYPVESIFLDHCITLCIHTLTCCLMYFVFKNLTASMLFAVNVGNNQVSVWLNGKRYGVSAILCLLMYATGAFGILFWVLTPFFQPSALSFPLITALNGHWYHVLILPVAFYIGKGHLVKWIKNRANVISLERYKKWDNRKIILILKTYAFYFFRGIVPFTPSMYISYLQRFGLTEKGTKEAYKIDAMAVFGLILITAIPFLYLWNKYMFFGLVWWAVTIAVYSNYITLTNLLNERYMYLPNIGLMLTFALVLQEINPFAWYLVFVVYVSRLMTFMPMYRGMDSFVEHHCYYFPKDETCWNFRANAASKDNNLIWLMYLTDKGLSHNLDSPRLWLHRAYGFNCMNDASKSRQCLNNVKKLATGKWGEILKPKIESLDKTLNKE
jgi:hypothetical protein